MDLEQAKSYACGTATYALVTGDSFKGLVELGKMIIKTISPHALANSKFICSAPIRRDFATMEEFAAVKFMVAVLGTGDEHLTVNQAAEQLVDTIWDAYIEWAQEEAQTQRVVPIR